ncbi:MAG: class I tRNA ligase family protein, partial [Patescibacteria group bacterium]
YSIFDNPNLQVTFLNKKKERINGRIVDLLKEYSFSDIEEGLQSLIAPKDAKSIISRIKPDDSYLQETDTFDTWFSSGHWPLVTLGYPNSDDFNYFYPTSVMETGWEIIRFWVSRMIMFGMYLTGKPPFSCVYLHGLVRAVDGKKMSKSLGNVIDPLDYVNEYGADALRMGLISGTANGKDFAFPKDKVIAYRNFANKLWNMARFMLMLTENNEVIEYKEGNDKDLKDSDKEIIQKLKDLIDGVDSSLEKFRFSDASDLIYQFMWHEVADGYIEHVKTREDKGVALGVLKYVFTTGLKVLHPFMPFVTEAIWNSVGDDNLLIENSWPN